MVNEIFNSKVKTNSTSKTETLNINQNISGSVSIKNPVTKESDSMVVAVVKTLGAVAGLGFTFGFFKDLGKSGSKAVRAGISAGFSAFAEDRKDKKEEKEKSPANAGK